MSRARDIANAITVPEFSGNVEIIGTSPELTFETTNSSHYNFQISVQENVSGGLEISSGSADADSSNDTFTPRLVVLNGGNVGIGNSSPSYLLSLSSASTTQAEIKTTATNGTAQIRFTNDARTYTIGIDNNDTFFLYDATGTSSRFVVNSSGNVGIGTTSVGAKLNVIGAGRFDNSNSTPVRLHINNSGSNDYASIYADTASAFKNLVINPDGGNVGIGTSPSQKLHVSGGNFQLVNGSSTLFLGDGPNLVSNAPTSSSAIRFDSDNLLFSYSNNERMRIDSSGNVLVGTTVVALSDATSGSGIALQADGQLEIAGSGSGSSGVCARFNRSTDDGSIVEFRKSGTTVGIIGVDSTQIYIGTGDTGLYFNAGNDSIDPYNTSTPAARSGAISLGAASRKFDDIHATNGTIQTSDENEKQDIASMTTAELAVGKRLSTLFKTFRWKDKVTEKADKARTHSGIIAQEVKAAFEAEGLDATKYALFCSDTWTNDDGKEQTRMGVRYPELLSFVASYNESRFTAIEARLAKLEGG